MCTLCMYNAYSSTNLCFYVYRKNVRLKAASHQAQTELHCMKNHIEDLTNEIDTIENQTKDDIIFNGNHTDIMKKIASQHERVLQLLKTNSAGHEEMKAGSLNVSSY